MGEDEGEVMFYTPIIFDETAEDGWVEVITVSGMTCNGVTQYGVRTDVLAGENAVLVPYIDEDCCSETPLPYQNGEGGEDYNPAPTAAPTDDDVTQPGIEASGGFTAKAGSISFTVATVAAMLT